MSLTIARYAPSMAAEWDALVAASPGAPFLFRRGYVDYHADRFTDCSFIFRDERSGAMRLAIPGNISEDSSVWTSHGGLTYGGLFGIPEVTAEEVIEAYHLLRARLKEMGVGEARVKPVPQIYSPYPTDAQLYALQWTMGARITACDLSTAIFPASYTGAAAWQSQRRRHARKAAAAGLTVEIDTPLSLFWPVLEQNLRERFGVAPVHTLAEMELLQSRFPDLIRVVTVRDGEEVLAGVVIYLATDTCAHDQYISASERGKAMGALDLLFHAILVDRLGGIFDGRRIFDFGRSTEGNGSVINHGLLAQKEGFGARGVVYSAYSFNP